ncbi:MAG: hypothetical protein HOI39_00410 [Flavobacteriales bacterium]|jgi:predicted  nucleic acid-binding Zn-ribbon protein|nr:hypothetical protein [Flavobacteriales bacterium]
MKKLLLLSLLVLFGCSKEDNTELIDSYNSQISSLNSQLSQLNSQLTQSQSQITSLQSQVNTISGLEATINNLESQITEYQSQVSSLESQISTLNSQVSSNSDLQANIDSLNAQLGSKIALISSLQAQILALENSQSTSTTDDTDDWPDYAAQGHSMSAIGVWTLYSIRGNPVSQAKQFEIKIYPSPNNPNNLNDTSSPQSGLMDFNGTTGLGFQYNYGQYNGNISVNTSGSGGDGIIRVDSSEIDGIDTTVFYNGTKYFYIIYYFEDEAGAEYLRVNLNINTTDENIYPDTLISAIFYRTK